MSSRKIHLKSVVKSPRDFTTKFEFLCTNHIRKDLKFTVDPEIRLILIFHRITELKYNDYFVFN